MTITTQKRQQCTNLCPRVDNPQATCSLCRVLDERDLTFDWLLTNAVIVRNTVYMQAALDVILKEGFTAIGKAARLLVQAFHG
jgi:hypothetical protein